jgi:hypothetical protein
VDPHPEYRFAVKDENVPRWRNLQPAWLYSNVERMLFERAVSGGDCDLQEKLSIAKSAMGLQRNCVYIRFSAGILAARLPYSEDLNLIECCNFSKLRKSMTLSWPLSPSRVFCHTADDLSAIEISEVSKPTALTIHAIRSYCMSGVLCSRNHYGLRTSSASTQVKRPRPIDLISQMDGWNAHLSGKLGSKKCDRRFMNVIGRSWPLSQSQETIR